MKFILPTIFTLLIGCSNAANGQVLKLQYEGFTVWLDCSKRGAVKFEYTAREDTGRLKRKSSFKLDPSVPATCQQKSSKTYKHAGVKYDRGHLVPANHLDHSRKGIAQSNFMTNILPQAANMNRGAWLLTEEIVECYRDIEPLRVIGGVIWGNDPSDDYYLSSHGVATPDAFWKVIIAGNRVIAWIVPNSKNAKRKALDRYLVSVAEIEKVTGQTIAISQSLKSQTTARSWKLPNECDKG